MAAVDAQVTPTNQKLNQLDPCKDLTEGTILTQTDHGARILPMLRELFVPGDGAWPWGTTAVADTKDTIRAELPDDYMEWITSKMNSMEILRANHSSGQSQRPEGLFVSQDTGSPTSLVVNPTLIITPGNILDPAGKTKKNATFVVNDYGTLPFPNIQKLGLDTVITGPITMTHTGHTRGNPLTGSYTVTIPTNLEAAPITGTFDATTFKAREGSEYFKGNAVKNAYIQTFLERGRGTDIECKKYILCKELGDTLEVEWLNTLIGTDGYTRENTVLITSDMVVFWRCIINSIGVIFTYQGKTKYYGSRQLDEAAKTLIQSRFILSMRKDVVRHNESVLQGIRAVIDSQYPASGPSAVWLNGNTWTREQYTNCISFLEQIYSDLTNINKDIDLYFNALTNVEAAKLLADRSHFQNPFVWYPSGPYFKINKKVDHLVGPNRFPFLGADFKPFSFTQPRTQGGARLQRGGVQTRAQKVARAIAMKAVTTSATWDEVLDDIISERRDDKEGYTISGLGSLPAVQPQAIVGNLDDYDDNLIWAENVGVGADALNRTPYFLYVYVRDYHPEIFTFARQVSAAFHEKFPPSPLMDAELESYPIQYTIREDDHFQITAVAGVPSHETLKTETLKAIGWAKKLVDSFPSLQTKSLMDFLTLFRTEGRGSLGQALPMLNEGEWIQAILEPEPEPQPRREPQGGGGNMTKEEEEEILHLAMDYYELYYAYKIRAVYQDRDLSQEELDLIYTTKPRSIQPSLNLKTTAVGTPQQHRILIGNRPKAPFLEEQAMVGVRRSQKRPNVIPEKLRSSFPEEKAQELMMGYGGKRYRKTRKQKKSKASRTKRRRTTKRIRRS